MHVEMEEFAVGHRSDGPYGIAADPDGAIWFTMAGTGKVGRFIPPDDLRLFDLSDPECRPTSIVASSQGGGLVRRVA